MTPAFAIATLRRYDACDLDRRVADLAAHLGRTPADDEPVPVAVWWSIPSTMVSDRWWSLRCWYGGRAIGVRAACLAARRVLHLAREEDRAVCLAAIEAADAWVADPTEARRQTARDAASAVNAAASVAVACASVAVACASAAVACADAYAAADAAASAAASAVDAAAYAVDAAADAAVDARAAAAATATDEQEAQRADLDRLLGEVSRG